MSHQLPRLVRRTVACAALVLVLLVTVYLVAFHRRLVIRGYISAVESAATAAEERDAFRRIGSAPKSFMGFLYHFWFWVVLLDEAGDRVPLGDFERATQVEIHWDGGYTARRVLLNNKNISGLFPYRFFKMMHDREQVGSSGSESAGN